MKFLIGIGRAVMFTMSMIALCVYGLYSSLMAKIRRA